MQLGHEGPALLKRQANAARNQPRRQNLNCNTARLGGNLVLDVLRHGVEFGQLHGVLRPALGHAPQVADVVEHLS